MATEFTKKCVLCGTIYVSKSRNSRYCSSECCAKAQVKNAKVRKTRAKKRKEYHENEEANQILNRAYRLANFTADTLGIPRCNCPLCNGEGDNQVHHKNLNPLDNSPSNLVRYCLKKHNRVHALQPDVNAVKVLSACLGTENPALTFQSIMSTYEIDTTIGDDDALLEEMYKKVKTKSK